MRPMSQREMVDGKDRRALVQEAAIAMRSRIEPAEALPLVAGPPMEGMVRHRHRADLD
mgnify:CR=1 FL=1